MFECMYACIVSYRIASCIHIYIWYFTYTQSCSLKNVVYSYPIPLAKTHSPYRMQSSNNGTAVTAAIIVA